MAHGRRRRQQRGRSAEGERIRAVSSYQTRVAQSLAATLVRAATLMVLAADGAGKRSLQHDRGSAFKWPTRHRSFRADVHGDRAAPRSAAHDVLARGRATGTSDP